METINITGNFPISESGRKFQAVFSCLFAFSFFSLLPVGFLGARLGGSQGLWSICLQRMEPEGPAGGVGGWNRVFLQALGKQNLGGSWAGLGQRNQTLAVVAWLQILW